MKRIMHNSDNDLTGDLTLSQILTGNFKAAAVFEKYNLDFCCSGNKSLIAACKEKGIDYKIVLSELNNFSFHYRNLNNKFFFSGIGSLIDHIVNYHHDFVRTMIPVIVTHIQIIASAHGKSDSVIAEIAKIFSIVYKDLKHHMMKEEEIIFPYIKQLVLASNNKSGIEPPYFGNLENPIRMLEEEHFLSSDELCELRMLTGNYEIKDNSCSTQIICYRELKEFEEDLTIHVFLENKILFPEAVRLEKEVMGT